MAFVQFTRPDGSPVVVNSDQIIKLTPVPSPDSPDGGPLKEGTRIYFHNNTHQDVKELIKTVKDKLNKGR